MELEILSSQVNFETVTKASKQISEVKVRCKNNEDTETAEELSSLRRKQTVQARIQLSTLCWTLFLAGWNDGSSGPLLPRIQEVYHIGFTMVSLMFVFGAVGYVSGAISSVPLTDRIGFGKAILFASLFQSIGYAIQATAPPFPAFIVAFVINGVGISIQNALANGYGASLKENAETKMGILQSAYGLGAFAAPLISTLFSRIHHWSFHYLISLGFSVFHTILLATVFRMKSQDECLNQIGQPAGERGTSEHSRFRQIISLRAVHLFAVFLLVYVGVEVTIGGWIVTFIIDVRGGGPNAGYISSGFFGGLAMGRVLFLWVGERRVLYFYAFFAICLEVVIWLVPSLIGDAVAVSFVGLLLGPMFPITMNHAGRVLPRWLLTGAIGYMAGFGQAGSAILPFLTGAIASKHGISSLQPFLVAMMVLMTILWALVPGKSVRID